MRLFKLLPIVLAIGCGAAPPTAPIDCRPPHGRLIAVDTVWYTVTRYNPVLHDTIPGIPAFIEEKYACWGTDIRGAHGRPMTSPLPGK